MASMTATIVVDNARDCHYCGRTSPPAATGSPPMLVLTASSTPADLQVASRMREIACRAGADALLAERAVAEALVIWQRTEDVVVALNTGLAYIDAVRAEQRAAQDEPFSWVESWPFLLAMGLAVAAIVAGRAFGWLP